MTIFNFGSINIDHVYRVPHLVLPGETLASRSIDTVLGGKGANQSIAAARAQAPVRHIGRIGEGDHWASAQMQEAGVDIGSIESVPGPSGHAIIQVDDHGENAILLHGGANQTFDRSILEHQLLQATADDWLLLQNECNAIDDAFDIALSRGMRIAFNPAPMTADTTRLPLEKCALLIVNETEAALLTGIAATQPADMLAALAERCPDSRLVLTLGAQGALLWHGGHKYAQAAVDVEVVDTTGAGDTFVGYFLAALIDDLDDQQCLQRACAAAALSVQQPGAAPSIPRAADVDIFLGR